MPAEFLAAQVYTPEVLWTQLPVAQLPSIQPLWLGVASAEFESTTSRWRSSLWQQEQAENLEYQLRRLGQWWQQLWPDRSPQEVPDWTWTMPEGLGHWLSGLLLSLILGLVFWNLYRGLRQYWRLAPLRRSRAQTSEPESSPSVAQWLTQAHKAQQQGQYRLACRALYHAMLQSLHNRDLIIHQPSRTDGEYLRLLRGIPQAPAYEVLIQTHQHLEFGQAPASAATWEQCQQAYQALQSDLEGER